MKTSSGKEIETRSLTYKEKKQTAINLARAIQDFGSIALNNYDICENCILSVDSEKVTELNKDKILAKLHNDDFKEIAKHVMEESGFDKKKES